MCIEQMTDDEKQKLHFLPPMLFIDQGENGSDDRVTILNQDFLTSFEENKRCPVWSRLYKYLE